jgi:hypothetical protein
VVGDDRVRIQQQQQQQQQGRSDMLELQVQLLNMWHEAGDRLRSATTRAAQERDRGEVTATTALIVLLVIAAVAAGGIIASKITGNANKVPSP